MEDKKKDFFDKILNPKYFISFCLIYILLIFGYGYIIYYKFLDSKFELPQAAYFGEMFGAFNAFFVGLAFIGILFTLNYQYKQYKLQKDELENNKKEFESQRNLLEKQYQLQKEELENNKNEIKNQKEQMEKQNEIMMQQKFETTFFNMLSLLNQIISSASGKINKSSDLKIGFEYFISAFKSLKDVFDEYGMKELGNPQQDETNFWSKYNAKYDLFFKDVSNILGYYFRYIYHIIKLVRDNFPDNIDSQKKYIDLIQAKMSNPELVLLFYYSLSKWAKNTNEEPKYNDLLDEYGFFENIDKSYIFHDLFYDFYPNTNFKFRNL
jgi:hypothetical protein